MEYVYHSASGAQGLPPLPANTAIGDYVIDQVLHSGPDENSYRAYARAVDGGSYHIVEYAASEERPFAAL
ncbi:MAG TPA: hypothetical protein VFU69_17505, partial [Ktedonobacterales bacterium]|nr:hypothetical protein [Ktedonobacterales bacterium]